MNLGFVTQVSPLRIQPKGSKTGIPVVLSETADALTFAVNEKVLCEVVDGRLYVVDRVA